MSLSSKLLVVVLALGVASAADRRGLENVRKYSRCELINELRNVHNQSKSKAATWTCIAVNRYGNGTIDNQRNLILKNIYPCNANDAVLRCRVTCYELREFNDTQFVDCMRDLFEEERHKSGDGLNVWDAFNSSCRIRAKEYSEGCDGAQTTEITQLSPTAQQPAREENPLSTTASALGHKIYEPCELAQELRDVHNVPLEEIGIWVCLASRGKYNASVIGPSEENGHRHYGLWHIFSEWWCGQDGIGGTCNIECSQLVNGQIAESVKCAQIILRETMAKTGDGFNAWGPLYQQQCRINGTAYVEGCGLGPIPQREITPATTTTPRTETIALASGSIAFEACDMARELLNNNVPADELDIWMCIIERSSNFNTSAISIEHPDGSFERGLFAVSDNYWCSRDGQGKGCNIECDKLMDSDVSDDIECARTIIAHEGFEAWSSYNEHCRTTTDRTQYRETCDLTITSNKSPIFDTTKSKQFNLCDVAQLLADDKEFEPADLNTWLCLIENESNFSTAILSEPFSDGSREHGMFRISDNYWCSTDETPKACNLSCDALHDADLLNDFECAKHIYRRGGFAAWKSYFIKCRRNVQRYLPNRCNVTFPEEDFWGTTPRATTTTITPTSASTSSTEDTATAAAATTNATGKVFDFCELARELRFTHRFPPSQISSYMCIIENGSHFNTSYVKEGNGEKKFGLFSIPNRTWCSKRKTRGCKIECDDLLNSDISDDVQCAKQIFIEEQSRSNNGFNAWPIYKESDCAQKSENYTSHCF